MAEAQQRQQPGIQNEKQNFHHLRPSGMLVHANNMAPFMHVIADSDMVNG